jgi:hypothetical protein
MMQRIHHRRQHSFSVAAGPFVVNPAAPTHYLGQSALPMDDFGCSRLGDGGLGLLFSTRCAWEGRPMKQMAPDLLETFREIIERSRPLQGCNNQLVEGEREARTQQYCSEFEGELEAIDGRSRPKTISSSRLRSSSRTNGEWSNRLKKWKTNNNQPKRGEEFSNLVVFLVFY